MYAVLLPQANFPTRTITDSIGQAARNNEEQFKTLKADWRHVSGGRWQLTFLVQDNDPPAAEEPEGGSDGKRVRRKLTDLYVDGLKSA